MRGDTSFSVWDQPKSSPAEIDEKISPVSEDGGDERAHAKVGVTPLIDDEKIFTNRPMGLLGF